MNRMSPQACHTTSARTSYKMKDGFLSRPTWSFLPTTESNVRPHRCIPCYVNIYTSRDRVPSATKKSDARRLMHRISELVIFAANHTPLRSIGQELVANFFDTLKNEFHKRLCAGFEFAIFESFGLQ